MVRISIPFCLVLGLVLISIACVAQAAPSFLSTLPFQIDNWHQMPAIESGTYYDRGDVFPYQLYRAELSPSGKYLLWWTLGIAFWDSQISIRNARTAIAEKAIFVFDPHSTAANSIGSITNVVWDPTDEHYLYASLNINHDSDYQSIITRQRWDGSAQTRLSRENENARLLSVTNDGKWLLAVVSPYPDPDGTLCEQNTKYIVQSIDDQNVRFERGWPEKFYSTSPNSVFAAENIHGTITLYNRHTARQVPMFSADRLLLRHPINQPYLYVGIDRYRWLPDSSGMLVNCHISERGTSNEMLWYVKTNGELQLLTTDVHLLASSANGRHWLMAADDKWYIVSAK